MGSPKNQICDCLKLRILFSAVPPLCIASRRNATMLRSVLRALLLARAALGLVPVRSTARAAAPRRGPAVVQAVDLYDLGPVAVTFDQAQGLPVAGIVALVVAANLIYLNLPDEFDDAIAKTTMLPKDELVVPPSAEELAMTTEEAAELEAAGWEDK